MDENIKLMDKRVDNLTVGDALKINAIVVTVMVAVPAVIMGGAYAVEAVRTKLAQRKIAKAEKKNQE